MAHELTINDGKAEMFSGQGITPWHKLGTVVNGLLTAKEAIDAARLNWNVSLREVFVDGKPFDENKATVRDDNNRVLSVVGNRYHVIQNSEAFSFFDEVVGEGQAVYDTAGSLKGGKKVWIMAKLNGNLFVSNNEEDKIDKNVLLTTSHDGSSGLWMQIVSTRVVCANTLSIALNGATNEIKIRHTQSYGSKKRQAMEVLGLCNAYFDNLQGLIDKMSNTEVSRKEAQDFILKLIPDSKDEPSTRSQNVRNDIETLFLRGKGNHGKTQWDLLNGVTEFVDHNRSTRTKSGEDEGRFTSAMLGSGYQLKARAFQLLNA
jgi:phage/plasmid-like protein (TIGR03299 family)